MATSHQSPAHRDSHLFLNRLAVWICVTATIVAVHTCLRIEWLNHRAGGLLPRDIVGTGNPKWREGADRAIRAAFHRRISLQEDDRILADHGRVTAEDERALDENPRPLTEIQQKELQRELDQSHANSALRHWVQTWGLLQYVLAPLAVVLSLVLLIRAPSWRGRLGFSLLGTLSGGAVVLMLYRGYFTSLGW